jgi:DNA-binding HxlR family transcriptional regulator
MKQTFKLSDSTQTQLTKFQAGILLTLAEILHDTKREALSAAQIANSLADQTDIFISEACIRRNTNALEQKKLIEIQRQGHAKPSVYALTKLGDDLVVHMTYIFVDEPEFQPEVFQ